MRITYNDITIERGQHGQYIVSAIVDGYLWQKQYYGYTKRKALRDAHAEVNSELVPIGNGYLWRKKYFSYTKREALKDAHATLNSELEG